MAITALLLVSAMIENGESRDVAIRLAKETLAAELKVAPESLALAAATSVEWRDSSLGCPEKGKSYLQVLTPGHRVTLKHEGRSHEMHVGAGRAVRCEGGTRARVGSRADDAASAAGVFAAARRDLARRLGVPEAEIKGGLLKRATWTDASLGCGRPGETYSPEPAAGYTVELEVLGERHVYHGDSERVVYCSGPLRR